MKSFKNLFKSDFYDEISKIDILREPETLKKQYTDEYERLTATYIKYYLPALFIVEDKISMASSLESRTPLCDNELVDFALSIPLSKKLSGYQLKHIPKAAMKGKLPDFLYRYPKRGFPTPLKIWFKNELREYIRDFIMDNLCYVPMFNSLEVERIISSFQGARIPTPFDEINVHRIWVILNLLIYFKFQKERYRNSH